MPGKYAGKDGEGTDYDKTSDVERLDREKCDGGSEKGAAPATNRTTAFHWQLSFRRGLPGFLIWDLGSEIWDLRTPPPA